MITPSAVVAMMRRSSANAPAHRNHRQHSLSPTAEGRNIVYGTYRVVPFHSSQWRFPPTVAVVGHRHVGIDVQVPVAALDDWVSAVVAAHTHPLFCADLLNRHHRF